MKIKCMDQMRGSNFKNNESNKYHFKSKNVLSLIKMTAYPKVLPKIYELIFCFERVIKTNPMLNIYA